MLAVYNVIMKYQDNGYFSDQRRSGHHRKTTPHDDNTTQRIVMHSLKSPYRKFYNQKGQIISVLFPNVLAKSVD